MAESFRFNFGASSEPGEVPAPSASQDDVSPAREETPALEVPQDWQSEELQLPGRVLLKPSGCTVAGASTAAGITGTSDLVPGRYEGGFKLWECSVDLCQYLRTAPDAPQLKGARVLELGCGHGLPGVLAALAGASSVTWQDYNASVLHSLTAPTVVANLRAQQEAGQQQTELRFFSGDWGALHDSGMLPAQQYDVILTADTLYSPAAQVSGTMMSVRKLHRNPRC